MSTTKLILPTGEIIESDNPDNLIGFLGKRPKYVPGIAALTEAPRVKRKYTKSKLAHSRWTGQEIETVAQNLNRTTAELMRMLPTRTSKAIYSIKGQLRHNRLTKAKSKVYTDFLNGRGQ